MTYGSNNMADKASTPDTPDTSDPQLLLKKRARRRLVGATALALLAIIVLPMVMDQEAKPPTQDIQIRIPSQDPASNAFSSRIASNKTAIAKPDASPPPPSQPPLSASHNPPGTPPVGNASSPSNVPATAPAQPSAPATAPVTPLASAANATHGTDKLPANKPESAAQDTTSVDEPKTDENTHATPTPSSNEHWVIQLGAYQEHGNVKVLQAKIKELGYRSYTEKIETANGSRTRVRAGPFTDRAAAEKAQERLKKIGAGGPTGGTLAPSKQP